MDKGITKEIFQHKELQTPLGIVLHKNDGIPKPTFQGFSLPVVVKPCNGGSSIGVSIVHTEQDYYNAIEKSFQYEDELIIEEYIEGRELSCAVLAGQALPPIEIIPKTGFFDYINKYQAGVAKEICPADLTEEITKEIQRMTLKAFQVLKLQVYGRVDFILNDKGQLYCLEVNTLPGMTPTSLLPQEAKTIDLNYEDLCELIIKRSIEEKYL
jgi:D-alanine-D-alanine ligase